ncbi:MAG TPA: MFS transporter [Acidimicrobiales bacterium]|nr:MFS transporter [Acidimicrobiales bacterium]
MTAQPQAPASVESVVRRFVALSALRWLPTGLLIPVTAILMQSRGLSLAQIGLVMAVGSVTVIGLELPTGGLADALGRRPVLLAASALDVVSVGLLLTAHSAGAFMAAAAVQGVFRALESGPLEAWYVDTSLRLDPEAGIERGLAGGNTAIGLAISTGALGTAGLTSLPAIGGLDPLVVPVAAALVLRIVDIGALALLVNEDRARLDLAWARAGVAAAPGVVRSTVRLVSRSRALRALVAVELLWGAGLVAVELFSGPRMVELLGDPERGVAVFALAVAAAWSVSSVGSAATGRMTARLGGGPARVGAVLRVVQGAAVAAMAVGGGPLGLVTGYLAFYLVHGSANVVHYGMVHRLVDADHRTTVISANSLATRLGGTAGSVGLGALATGAGIPTALAVAAAVLASAAPLYRMARAPAPVFEGFRTDAVAFPSKT